MTDGSLTVVDQLKQNLPWMPVEIEGTNSIPTGDMPGDKVKIGPVHIRKSQVIFPRLLELLVPVFESNTYQRAVVAVCGGSGVGKSEIASLISLHLSRMGLGSYTLSGDNYPHRIPKHNDAQRLHIFRQSGIQSLISHGQYLEDRAGTLKELQATGSDASPDLAKIYPWLALYQEAGRDGLKTYLGTPNEINFGEVSDIVAQFKNGASHINLKRMGREENELWYETVDFSDKHILVIEWTHGNNRNLHGVDIPIFLHSTPQETLEHRRSRSRDGGTDSPFTMMVLDIEQDMLLSQVSNTKLILSKSGEVLPYEDFKNLVLQTLA